MKGFVRVAFLTAALIFVAGGWLFAQDNGDSFSGGFGNEAETDGNEGFGDGFGEDSGEGGFGGDFGGDFGEESSSGEDQRSALSIGGDVILEGRCFAVPANYDDTDWKLKDAEVSGFPQVNLALDYKGASSDLVANLRFSRDTMFKDYKDVIDEAYMRIYYGSTMNVEAGFMKVVWGKGDELHALDFLNAVDLTDFFNKSSLERKIVSPMVKFNKYFGMSGLLEVVYIPWYTYPKYDEGGRWEPYFVTEFNNKLSALKAKGLSITKNGKSDAETLNYSQGAIRFTNSTAGWDYGFTYSYGFMPLPTIKFGFKTVPLYGKVPSSVGLSPERAHIFGLDAAKVLLTLNCRAEFAYYMTEDFTGDDANVQNNKIMWVFGLDRDLPLSNLNVLVETQGAYTLMNSELTSEYDMDYNEDDVYTQDMVIFRLKDSFNHDRIRPEVAMTLHCEDLDFMLRPGVEFVLKDDISLNVKYSYFYGDDDTIFGANKNNNFLDLKLAYSF